MITSNPVFCALDTSEIDKAKKLADVLHDRVAGYKLGLEFFLRHGWEGYRIIADFGLPIFLDLKLHDIPNTVAGAMQSLLPFQPQFITLHAAGGEAMMRAAAEAKKSAKSPPKLLAVTVLTSLDARDLTAVGQTPDPARQALCLARLAKDSGMDGVICSPEEVKDLRAACGPDFILMVPGIRPSWAMTNDQKRVTTPREAIDAGATYLVIGRPITGAENPGEAASRILAELA
ncbi:MAG: orotidine-5'-phosphate decarboxylase [Bdellovibrionales bacterium]